jgi:hypothetical protein
VTALHCYALRRRVEIPGWRARLPPAGLPKSNKTRNAA